MKKYFNILKYLSISILLWVSITITIQRFISPYMTSTELIKKIPKSILLKFNKYEK